MSDQLTLALNYSVPIPAWWPTGKYVAIIAKDQWGVADCNTFKKRLGWDIPTYDAHDLPHHTWFPEGTYLMYSTETEIGVADLANRAHHVDKKYRLAYDRSVDMDLYVPYYGFPIGTNILFSHFTTIYSTEAECFPEEWDIINVSS